jgi:hypothetical protein
MDDDWPGARYRGATWVEFYGGPWDGTMVEEKEVPLPFLGKINVLPKGDGSAGPLGEYRPVGWADEELKIVRLEWHKFTPRGKKSRS